jgi:peptide/nickel transport system substrate-binding protein
MGRDKAGDEEGFTKFGEFLGEWSRRDFLRRSGGAVAWAAFMGGGLELLEACGQTGGTSSPSGEAVKKGGKLVEGNSTDVTNFNSVLTTDVYSSINTGIILDRLLTSQGSGGLVPEIAKEMPKVSADQLTYTFNLRQDVKWTDGSPLTSEDVVFTYQLMYDDQYKEVRSPRRGALSAALKNVTAPDKYTVVFNMQKVFAPFLALHGQYGIVPKKAFAGLTPTQINTADWNFNPTLSSGPFKFVKWEKGQQVTYARNDSYYAGTPNLDTYIYKTVPKSEVVQAQLKTGEIDVGPVAEIAVDEIRNSTNLNLVTFPVAIFLFMAYNQDEAKTPAAKIFKDKVVRQALLYAADRQSMVDSPGLWNKNAVVADSVMVPVWWAYSKDVTPKYSYDVKNAEKLLDSAGWVKGADGIRAKGGVKLAFKTTTNADRFPRSKVMDALVEQWSKIGVQATRNDLPTLAAVAENLTNAKRRDFDLIMLGFSFGQDPDESQLWHSSATRDGGFNGFNFKNPKADQLLDDAVATLDQAKRKDIYKKFQDLMADEVPAPILFFNKGLWAVNKRVHNYNLATYNQFNTRPWLKDVWVADAK